MAAKQMADFKDPQKQSKSLPLPAITLIHANEPTDRFVLWIIANASHAYNVRFFVKHIKNHHEMISPDHWMSKHLKFVQSLKMRGFIKQDF